MARSNSIRNEIFAGQIIMLEGVRRGAHFARTHKVKAGTFRRRPSYERHVILEGINHPVPARMCEVVG